MNNNYILQVSKSGLEFSLSLCLIHRLLCYCLYKPEILTDFALFSRGSRTFGFILVSILNISLIANDTS